MNKKKLVFVMAVILLSLIGCAPKPNDPLAVGDGVFTIAVLSDTQFLSRDYPNVLMEMADTLTRRQESMNLQYIVHTGDLVQDPYAVEQWEAVRNMFDKFQDIPHGVLAGNHDLGNGERKFTIFLENFGEARFQNSGWYKESHEGGRAHCDLVTIGGDEFVFVYLSDDPSACCVEFANEIFREYSDRIGVLCLHRYLKNADELGDMGIYLEKAVIERNANVRLVLCGHEDDVGALTMEYGDVNNGENVRTVHSIIFNYQDEGARNAGAMLLLRLNKTDGTIKGFVYEENYKEKGIVEKISLPINW